MIVCNDGRMRSFVVIMDERVGVSGTNLMVFDHAK